ncbi:hypothetical protein [Vibrio renipiscarius]|uniref:Uncharacterized protein n=1 Tax=Vibrio renipiscarius TaxID=1461322 RepID=A0A0C2JRL3_9VIBR|nr:hypothetical protein [Vibrio renipiscarius]KII79739.1 hypothetical protein PL18_08810 [Vibrio renipiscarius]KII80634.1 hypothetical protein OJ16_04855 [Vibrio renipiscarius]
MGEKIKIKSISETVLIDGVYQSDERSGVERRKNTTKKWRFYERRKSTADPRYQTSVRIDEEV